MAAQMLDIEVDGEQLSDEYRFSDLVSEERVNRIIEKAAFYGYSGERVKGLIFCHRNAEAAELSAIMNNKGFKTVAISGETSPEKRIEFTDRLQQDEKDGNELDYILSVDVFNESGITQGEVRQMEG